MAFAACQDFFLNCPQTVGSAKIYKEIIAFYTKLQPAAAGYSDIEPIKVFGHIRVGVK
jgi:hypothetical protein